MKEYITIRLPREGRISGHCKTMKVKARTPGEAAQRFVSTDDEGCIVLVVDGLFTYAFKYVVPTPRPRFEVVPA